MRELLARGADPSSANDRGWTPLHQAGYGNDVGPRAPAARGRRAHRHLRRTARAARPSPRRSSGATRRSPTLLAERGVAPYNLRIAAGLGRRDLIRALVLRRRAACARAPARRAGSTARTRGFPIWEPSDDPQEILDEALVWAAKSDRAEVLGRLVELGADLDGDPYRGTALIWAGACGQVETIRRLIELGADPDRAPRSAGPSTARASPRSTSRRRAGKREAVRALLAAGADPTIRDDLYDGPPAGWAEHGCHRDIAALLREHGG